MDQPWTERPEAPASTAIAGPPTMLERRFRPPIALLGVMWLLTATFQFSAWIWLPLQQGRGGLGPVLDRATRLAPDWLRPAVQYLASGIEHVGTMAVAGGMVLVALLLGLALISRVGLRTACWLGMAYSIFCWVALGGLGAPYGDGQTDPGAFPAYLIAFLFVLSVAPLAAPRRLPFPLQPSPTLWVTARVLFGLLWLCDAVMTWEPYFITHFLEQLTPALQGQPHWILVYLNFVTHAVQVIGPVVVAVIVAVIETGIALSLLTGWLSSLVYPLAFLYSLVVWTTAEGWGGPYSPAGTGIRGNVIGTALIYALIFMFLIAQANRRVRMERSRIAMA